MVKHQLISDQLHIILAFFFFSLLCVLGITIMDFIPREFPTKLNPIPVFPAVPSTITPPFSIFFSLRASFIICSAGLSFTDPPGFKNSHFPYISHPDISEASFNLIKGVFPIQSEKLFLYIYFAF